MSNNEEVVERLLNYFNLTMSAIEKRLGISNGTLGKYKRGAISTPFSLITGLKLNNLNPDYFLTGEGSPEIGSDAVESAPVAVECDESKPNRIPFYCFDVMASVESEETLLNTKPTCYYELPGFADCLAAFPVYGDSMKPKILNGDVVVISEKVPEEKILWGETYLVVTDAWRVIKTVHPGETEEFLVLRSVNPNYEGDTAVNKNDIKGLYLIKGKVSKFSV
ncbi:S24 family peptidase [Treponema sp.]|uniref:S24 family peptidase n=1 Tax=Treponema sp. TaxID=166 RepID=UPI00298E6EFF|nr:S24 family peptidase [Treponema sp.]MCQ2242422.1 hypothetical protein [Treponema sp.]